MYQNVHTAAARGGASIVPRVLLSYLPQFKTVEPLQRALARTCEPTDYCVDSGAHVWLGDFFKKGLKPPVEAAEKFLQYFVTSIRNLERKPTYVVELDVQQMYGDDTITAWRRDIWAPLERETGVRVCYVWHPPEEWRGWRAMAENESIRYLGMGGIVQVSDEQRMAMAKLAYAVGKPVHGFAGVNIKWITSTPFYSVDSTSWAVGAQAFGAACTFDPSTGKMTWHHIGNSAVRKDPKKAMYSLIKTGIHASDVIDRGRANNVKRYSRYYEQAAKPYQELEAWHTARWRAKGVDWEAQLAKHGNSLPGAAGGHHKAPGV
jgi:hypothetical protein